MKNAFPIIAIIMLILGGMLLSTTQPVTALAGTPTPQIVYVDETRNDGNENGSTAYPYSDFEEGRAYAESLDFGGRVYVRTTPNGNFEDYGVYLGVNAAGGGIGLPELTLYILLAVLALVLVLAGRYLQRRSHQIRE